MTKNLVLISVSLLLIFLSNCETESYLRSEADSYYSNFKSSESLRDGGEYTGENYQEYEENPFVKVLEQPLSTFSVDADGGAYSNMRRYFRSDLKPPVAAVRIEEFINYFTFDYEDPANGENISMNTEISTCPWNSDHHLLRIGIKGKSIPENELPATNFVFLIDVSGSMDSDDKLGILKSGFKRLTDNLTNKDRIAIVTYAGSVGVHLQSTTGNNKDQIKKSIDKLRAKGSTAGGSGIKMAYSIAEDNFIEGGNNRIILGSDGDFNVGLTSTEELVELIEEKRENGIYFTVLGVGTGNLNDHMMEQIANNGNGNYEYIDNAMQVEKVFVHEKSKFQTVAKDSKFQISFNPNMVEAYRLIGYENRMLENEDFEEDNVDAGEIGAGQTITAMYELQLLDVLNVEKYGSLDFRYKFPDENVSRLLNQDILTMPVNINTASENQRFATAVTGFGLILRESQYKGDLSKQMLINLGEGALGIDEHGYREECLSLMQHL